MFNIPLPPRPHLDNYKKRAKELLAAAKSSDPNIEREFARNWVGDILRLVDAHLDQRSEAEAVDNLCAAVSSAIGRQRERGSFGLANAQFIVAELHGFGTWASFATEIRLRETVDSPFEAAVECVIEGHIDDLRLLLATNPDMIHARSTRAHRATLLHYTAANGVEDYRQRTPPNAADIARLLLDAGAEVDALAETYGGGRGQTTMNLLVSSAHPDLAGVQGKLAELLLDYGAKIEGLDDDGSPIQTALAFGYLETAHALHRRGARVGNITVAAALNRVDLVRDFVEGRGPEIKPTLAKLYWSGLGKTTKDRQRIAFFWACAFGALDVVKYFLAIGMSVSDADDNKMTPLHNATMRPHMDVVRLLLTHKPPLEVKNQWGGTVFNSTMHFADEARRWHPERIPAFVECAEALIAAGADLSVVDYVMGIPDLDAVLDKHRPRPKG